MNNYDDIIHYEYRGSTSMKKMSLEARAAQFAPFAALTGHDIAIQETARSTSEKFDLSPDEQSILDQKLNIAIHLKNEKPELVITFFIPDNQKTGGSYVTAKGHIMKYLEHEKTIILSDNSVINIREIIAIEGKIFNNKFC